MANADFDTREKIANLLINSVDLHSDRAIIKGNIPVTQIDVLSRSHHASPLLFRWGEVGAEKFGIVRNSPE